MVHETFELIKFYPVGCFLFGVILLSFLAHCCDRLGSALVRRCTCQGCACQKKEL